MHDPISALFVKHSTCSLAASALPGAPVTRDEPMRRHSTLLALRRRFRR
jgi:hypothetical protein